jgi:ribosomal protein S18 acetylase RimI-like enzyme
VSVSVREATATEFAAVDALARAVYVEEGYTAAEHVEVVLGAAERSRDARVLVACDESGTMLGTVTLVLDDGPARRMSFAGEAEIRLLAVSKDARGRGAGSELVRECLSRARARGRARCVLCTQPSMAAAHRIYERAGFMRDPSRDFTTPAGAEMLVYVIDL